MVEILGIRSGRLGEPRHVVVFTMSPAVLAWGTWEKLPHSTYGAGAQWWSAHGGQPWQETNRYMSGSFADCDSLSASHALGHHP